MSPSLSIVVPVLNEGQNILALSCLYDLRAKGVEIILADGGSADKTCELAAPLVDNIVYSPKGRARQMNAGAAIAKGKYLLFLHVDTQLPQNVYLCLERWLDNEPLWGFFSLKLSGKVFLLRCVALGINLRSLLRRLGTGDQCLFFQRTFFWQQGGFADIPLMEDVEINHRCQKVCVPLIEKESVTTDSCRWEQNGIISTVFNMWWLRLQYAMGISPDVLVEKYYPDFYTENYSHSFPYSHLCFAQFAKSPELGKVKTRMQVELTAEEVLELHNDLVEQSFNNIQGAGLAPQTLWVTGVDVNPFSKIIIESDRVFSQSGRDLGERMRNAINILLQRNGCSGALVVGSDCPFMDATYLQEALAAMCTAIDVVIGPANDGGYVLIGAKRDIPELFMGVEWGTDKVLQQTLDKCEALQLSVYQLPPLADIDRPEDLTHWFAGLA